MEKDYDNPWGAQCFLRMKSLKVAELQETYIPWYSINPDWRIMDILLILPFVNPPVGILGKPRHLFEVLGNPTHFTVLDGILTCLVVVIHFHHSWFQIPHRHILLYGQAVRLRFLLLELEEKE